MTEPLTSETVSVLGRFRDLTELKRAVTEDQKGGWNSDLEPEIVLALIEVAEAANGVCIAQDGYLIELMDKLQKLEAV
jgi:hypothetical protein